MHLLLNILLKSIIQINYEYKLFSKFGEDKQGQIFINAFPD